MSVTATNNDESEVTCELQLMQVADEEEGKELDWSISGISAVSGYDPYQLHSEVSSSCCNTPEKKFRETKPENRIGQQSIRQDLQKLVGSVKDLELNLVGISKMSVSPRTETNLFLSRGTVSMSETEKTLRNRSHDIDVTPPVRDTGPGSQTETKPLITRIPTFQSSKLEKMKTTLQQLEEAGKKYSSSKIPRRSLSFIEVPLQNHNSSKHTELLDWKKITPDTLTRTTNGSTCSPTILSSDTDKTVIEKINTKEDDLQIKLAEEMKAKMLLENLLTDLKVKLSLKEEEVDHLKRTNEEKDKLLLELKGKWTECASVWNQKLKNYQSELENQRKDKLEIQEQFQVCQEELCKALQLASDFKQKIDEEEILKQDILTQLLSEKAAKTSIQNAEQEKINKMQDMNLLLKKDLEHQAFLNAELKTNFQSLLKKYEINANAEKVKISEASELQENNRKLEALVNSLQAELKATQGSLHAFYGSQMESIMMEKIQDLQNNVSQWEQSLNQEKQEQIESIRKTHSTQLEAISKKYNHTLTELTNKCKSLEGSLAAVRIEADALRDQLRLQKTPILAGSYTYSLSQPNNELDWSSILMQQSIPRLHNNLGPPSAVRNPSVCFTSEDEGFPLIQRQINRQRPATAKSSLNPEIMNNQVVLKHPRTSSAEPLSKVQPSSSTSQDLNTAEHDASSSIMSVTEKREIVTSFIRQFLLDHPASVLDKSFLSNLNEMAVKLIQESSFLSEDGESNSDKNFGANKGLKSNQGSLKYQTDDQYGTDADKKRKAKRPVWK